MIMQIQSTPATSNAVTAAQPAVSPAVPSQALSQNDFLKLLVAQMTSQDPMNPTSNQDLLTQTAQLSTLQSNTALQSTLTQLLNSQSLAQAGTLLGRQVTLQVNPTTQTQGVVSGVNLDSGAAHIVVNGVAYGLGQVISISTPSAAP
jgi:flagellar basal-body rod modification protein FlgD